MPSKQPIPVLNSKAFTCCFCCHVKTGTIIYGIISVIVHLLLLGLLILVAIHPDVLYKNEAQMDDGIIAKPMQTEEDFFQNFGDTAPEDYRWTKDKLCVLFAMTLAWIVSVLALIYGTARNYASYLMPCFCLQVFDFCFTCLGVVSSFTFTPDVHGQMRQWRLEDYESLKALHGMDRGFVMLIAVALVILILSVKAYIMGMVWSCYRYIQLHVAARSVVREYTVDPDSEMLLPPCYEDAIKISSSIPQPPAYAGQEA